MKDMLLSGYERQLDLDPLQVICQGKSILDLGANVGLHSLKALEYGSKHVTCIENSLENIQVLQHLLPSSKSTLIKESLTKQNLLLKLNKSYDTIFYLAVHQHLERQVIGSGWKLIDNYIQLNPQYVVFRSKGFEESGKEYHEKNFGPMIYFSSLTPSLAPVMIFKRK